MQRQRNSAVFGKLWGIWIGFGLRWMVPVVADRDEGAAWWHTQYTGRRGIPGLSEGSGYVCVCVCVCVRVCVLSLALLFVCIMG